MLRLYGACDAAVPQSRVAKCFTRRRRSVTATAVKLARKAVMGAVVQKARSRPASQGALSGVRVLAPPDGRACRALQPCQATDADAAAVVVPSTAVQLPLLAFVLLMPRSFLTFALSMPSVLFVHPVYCHCVSARPSAPRAAVPATQYLRAL